MTLIPFGEYRPDVSDYEGKHSQNLLNVLPRGEGYGPVPSFAVFSGALAAACRGYFYARKTDGSISVFLGTSTKLYNMNNTTLGFTDVSKGSGTYSALSSTDNWQFVQFNNFVVAVQANAPPQVFDLTSSTLFADLGGSPPQARYISVVGRFLVLSGLLNNPYRIQWSGLNATTTWTSGVNQSDFQDLADGGIVRGIAGGESGVIFQDTAMRRMTYTAGTTIFQIERIAEDRGLLAPYSVIRAGEKIFFLAPQGFHVITPGAIGPTPIGRERVDRTVLADIDTANLQLLIGAADPGSTRVFWAYKSVAGQSALFDKLLCYDWALDRFTMVALAGEYIASLAAPGITLEGLDAVVPSIAVTGAANNGSGLIRLTIATTTRAAEVPTSPPDGASVPSALLTGQTCVVASVGGTTEANGSWTITVIDPTHVDLQGSTFANGYTSGGLIAPQVDSYVQSLDSISNAALTKLALVNSAHKIGFLTGPNLEATLESSEHGAMPRRIFVRGLWLITDAPGCYGAVSARENLQSSAVYAAEALVNAQGFVPAQVDTRLARGKVRVPAGTTWTYAIGIDPEIALGGMA